jgi:hypothetical protein
MGVTVDELFDASILWLKLQEIIEMMYEEGG